MDELPLVTRDGRPFRRVQAEKLLAAVESIGMKVVVQGDSIFPRVRSWDDALTNRSSEESRAQYAAIQNARTYWRTHIASLKPYVAAILLERKAASWSTSVASAAAIDSLSAVR